MATPTAAPRTSAHADQGAGFELFLAWVQKNQKVLLAIFAALALGAIGYAYYLRSEAIKRQRAEESLGRAMQALASGNPALAQADLDRVSTRYGDTGPGVQAAMLLAQTYYDEGKAQQGVDRLKAVEAKAPREFRAPVAALIADGYDVLGKPAEAAKEYERAASLTAYPIERANFLASAARFYALAGNKPEAIRIWTTLAEDPDSPVAGEAKVRLGELTAKAARAGA